MPLAHSASGSSGGPVHSASAASSNVPGSGGGGASSNQIFSLTGAITNPTIHQQQHHHHHQSHPTSDSLLLALRQKPTARLFRALFQYIPVRDSPNDNPQLELPLQAGEYILVHGEMDEDQFYHGETLDGQSGLVPSNYVERVTDQQLLSNSSRAPSPSFPLIVPPHLTQIAHDFSTPCTSQQPLPDSVCPYPPVDITKVTVQEIRQTETPRDALIAPQHVRVSSLTPISAIVSWYPSDSNAEHIILLNAVKVGVCPPSIFQVQLNGLSPSTIYRVSVRTKHPKAVLEQRPVERCVDFKTMPKIGLPDPPTNVQVEIGPQPGTLLVSWTPVITQPLPPSRAAIHSYLVYADGRNIAQVPNADADHILLRLSDFADDPPIFITVRTRTREGAVSSDSNVSRVPRGISLNISSGLTSAKPQLQTNAGNPTPLIQPHLAIRMPAGLTASSTPGLLQASCLGLSNNQPILGQTTYSSGLQLTVPTGTLLAGQQIGQSQGSNLPRISLNHMQASDPTMTLPGQSGSNLLTRAMSSSYPINLPVSATIPVTNSLNSYTAVGVANPLSASGNSNIGYLTSNVLMDGTAKGYQADPALQEWKSHNQYYTFHPKSLCREIAAVDEKPSVLEMEHNYLLKHRTQQWPAMPQSSRARFEHYIHNRVDARLPVVSRPTMPLVSRGFYPPSLARVRSEEICSTRSEPDLRPVTLDDYNCRWFVALFDYSHHMSPNANAQQEELSFRKHQLIKVFGDVDQDGFYTGQIGHRVGLVPSNMVIEIAKDDLLPIRRRSDALPEPSIRRMRWGSLKSRSYDHAGDRRSSHRKQLMEQEHYASLDRRDHSVPNRPLNYFTSRRAPLDMRLEMAQRGEYFSRSERGEYAITGEPDEPFERYSNARDYFVCPRDYRFRESQERRDYYRDERDGQDRDRRGDYYWEERDAAEVDRRDMRDMKDLRDVRNIRDVRDMREREMKADPRDMRDIRDFRDIRDQREGRFIRDQSLMRRERDQERDERDDQRSRDYRETRDYRERETREFEYRDIRKEQEQMIRQMDDRAYNSGRDPSSQRVCDRRERDYSKERSQESYRDNYLVGQAHQRYSDITVEDSRYGRINGENLAVRKFVAKFDYDSRQLSPNVDAEQVELSFHAGDIITVYGEMDEDGFYMGELNGIRGLVPSNFLHTSPPNSLMPPQMTPGQILSQQQSSQSIPPITIPMEQPKAKGVVFQEAAKKGMPPRQTSQSLSKPATTAKGAQKAGTAPAQKTLSKKPSDIGSKSTSNARKTSQSSKKSEGAAKKK